MFEDKGYVNIRTRMELVEKLFCRGQPNICVRGPDGKPVIGILQGATRESGSGRSFNLNILTKDGLKTVYWMSTD